MEASQLILPLAIVAVLGDSFPYKIEKESVILLVTRPIAILKISIMMNSTTRPRSICAHYLFMKSLALSEVLYTMPGNR